MCFLAHLNSDEVILSGICDDILCLFTIYCYSSFKIDQICTSLPIQDPSNGREALLEAMLDEQEGADMLMVKPGENMEQNHTCFCNRCIFAALASWAYSCVFKIC